MWMLATALAQEPCEAVIAGAELETRLQEAIDAWSALDVEGYFAAADDIRSAGNCLNESVDRRTAAEVHRVLGLRWFMERDKDAAVTSFAAAHRADPAYRFPVDLVPSGNPAWEWYEEARDKDLSVTPIQPPGVGHIEIDGRPSLAFSPDVPALVQLFDGEGTLTYTGYLVPGATLPAYEPAAKGARLGVRYDAKVIPLHVPLAIGAGVFGAAGIGLYGVGVANRSRFSSETNPPAFGELATLKSRANTFSTVGVALGGTALALGTSAWLTRRF